MIHLEKASRRVRESWQIDLEQFGIRPMANFREPVVNQLGGVGDELEQAVPVDAMLLDFIAVELRAYDT